MSKPFDEGLRYERALFLELLLTPESRALRHAFFAERAASKIPGVGDDTPRRKIEAKAHGLGELIGQVGGKLVQRVVHEPPLHLGGDAAGPLVHRDNPSGVNRLAVLVVEDLVLRVGQLQPALGPHLRRAE